MLELKLRKPLFQASVTKITLITLTFPESMVKYITLENGEAHLARGKSEDPVAVVRVTYKLHQLP